MRPGTGTKAVGGIGRPATGTRVGGGQRALNVPQGFYFFTLLITSFFSGVLIPEGSSIAVQIRNKIAEINAEVERLRTDMFNRQNDRPKIQQLQKKFFERFHFFMSSLLLGLKIKMKNLTNYMTS
jgi:hypothetical protein